MWIFYSIIISLYYQALEDVTTPSKYPNQPTDIPTDQELERYDNEQIVKFVDKRLSVYIN